MGVKSFIIIIIVNSGQMLLSGHVCDDMVIAEETFNLRNINLLEIWTGSFLYLAYQPLVQETSWAHRILSRSMHACVLSGVYNNIWMDIFMW